MFKQYDKVRVITTEKGLEKYLNQVGTISEIYAYTDCPFRVLFDRNICGAPTALFNEPELELIEEN